MPTWKNLKIFALGALWAGLLTLTPVLATLWDWITDPIDPSINWRKLLKLAGECAVPALIAYYRKHQALLQEPPRDGEKADAAAA